MIEGLSTFLQSCLEEVEKLGHGVEERVIAGEECYVGHVEYFQEVADGSDLSFVVMMRPNSSSFDPIGHMLYIGVRKVEINKLLKGSNLINKFSLQCLAGMHDFVSNTD